MKDRHHQEQQPCGLCQQSAVLHRSHFIPAGILKLCRAPDDGDNPHPVMVADDYYGTTARQEREHLLCTSCEKRFDQRGENWVIRNCGRDDGRFRLRDILLNAKPEVQEEEAAIYAAQGLREINTDAMVYFAMSVFWRAAAHHWKVLEKQWNTIHVTPSMTEDMRLFLLDRASFPTWAALQVWVSLAPRPLAAVNYPTSTRDAEAWSHHLYIPGIQFILVAGSKIPQHHRKTCFATHPRRPLLAGVEIVNRVVANHLVTAIGPRLGTRQGRPRPKTY